MIAPLDLDAIEADYAKLRDSQSMTLTDHRNTMERIFESAPDLIAAARAGEELRAKVVEFFAVLDVIAHDDAPSKWSRYYAAEAALRLAVKS